MPVRLIILTYCFCKRWTKVLDFVKKFGRTYLALDLTPNQNCQTFSKWYFNINFSLHFQSQLNISFPFKFWDIFILHQTSKRKLCEKIINDFQPLIIFAKSSVLDVWQGWNTGLNFPMPQRCYESHLQVFLTHPRSMFPFYLTWKHQWFSGVSMGNEMGTLARNGSIPVHKK